MYVLVLPSKRVYDATTEIEGPNIQRRQRGMADKNPQDFVGRASIANDMTLLCMCACACGRVVILRWCIPPYLSCPESHYDAFQQTVKSHTHIHHMRVEK